MDARANSGRWPTDATFRTDGGGPARGGTLVGLTTTDGVLLGADSRTSRGTTVAGDRVRKIEQVHPTAVLGSTDHLGAVQSFVRTVRVEANRYEMDRGEPMSLSALGTTASEALQAGPSPTPSVVLGGVDEEGPHLFTVDAEGGLLEDRYVAAGSGRETASGVLEARATGTPTADEARRLAGAALAAATERDALTGIEVHVADVTADGVSIRRHESSDELR